MRSFAAVLLLCAVTSQPSEFPKPYNSEREKASPLRPAQAAAGLQLPAGFNADVFASEPDVQNPIAMAWDGRGRVWVAENYTYAERNLKFDLSLRDRLLIFEDKDGDGHFDSRKVFSDELQMLTSVEVGHGGVWLMCPPRLIFVPDRDGDDRPDGAPEVVLDGFTVPSENYHNFANGLHFGPDGWLYGRCGASSPGQIGTPGTAAEKRIPLRGTIWRYHPVRKTFEALTCGATNPWGHDWNEYGELFLINTVNGHLWHIIPGEHYVRPHTIDPNPRAYELIDMHADHWHFDTAEGWAKGRDGRANAYGGGHAHIGMMIYQGDNWPAEYRGKLYTLNLHGRRANQEILNREGSGYMGRHGKDLFVSDDPWFRGMEISSGPDGAALVLDWSDTGECHESTGVHRTSGRIYKISYGKPAQPKIGDLAKLSSGELVKLQLHTNDWFARHARVELATRVTEKRDTIQNLSRQLHELFEQKKNPVIQLRALWGMASIGGLDRDFLEAQLVHANEHVRAWAIRLLTDDWPLDTVLSTRPAGAESAWNSRNAATLRKLVYLAESDPSALVRLVLASTLQRLPPPDRVGLANALVKHAEDANDHNLPLLIWYGLIPLADQNLSALPAIAAKCEWPATRKYMARRVTEDIEKEPGTLNQLVAMLTTKSETFQTDVLEGMSEALTGWRKAAKPAAWDGAATELALTSNESIRKSVRELSVLFGDGRAITEVRTIALDPKAPLAQRKSALQALINSNPGDLRATCEGLLGIQFLNSVAAQGLARLDEPSVGAKLVRSYRSFHLSERPALLAVLVSRKSFAEALLDAVSEGRIARTDISAFHARQIQSLNDPALARRLAEVWGELRESKTARDAITTWKSQLTGAPLAKADLGQGRAVFNLACASCHRLYGEGGKIGPDLSGAGRDNLDYLLENIVDPSGVVGADFRMAVVTLKDGRTLNGIVTARTERTLTLQTMTESLSVERGEIEKFETSNLSLMPEGLLDSLKPEQARDLIAYLMHQTQVPLPAQKEQPLPMR